MVTTLRDFKPTAKKDHDIARATVLLVKWGDRANLFAVCRVLGIILLEDGVPQDRVSCKLDKKNKD